MDIQLNRCILLSTMNNPSPKMANTMASPRATYIPALGSHRDASASAASVRATGPTSPKLAEDRDQPAIPGETAFGCGSRYDWGIRSWR